MSALRRLAFLLLCLPAFVYFGLRWILTGRSALEGMDALDEWGTR